jgi:hypothetical protein
MAQQGRSPLMADMVYTSSNNDIDALVAACQFSPDAYVLVEQFPDHVVTGSQKRQNLLLFICLKDLKTERYQNIRLNDYTSGRVFDEDAEIRWERTEQAEQQDGTFHVVYVGPEREQSPIKQDDSEDKMPGEKLGEPHDTYYYLFGELLDTDDIKAVGSPAEEGDYAQLRIPRLLRYPRLPDGQTPRRLKLTVCEYVDNDTGKVRLFRFNGLQAGEK